MDIGCGSYYRPLDSGIRCIYGLVQGFLKVGGVVVSAASQATPQGNGDIKFAGESETTPSLEEIVRRIQMLESSGGKYNYSKCEAIGKYNRYGYGIPGNGKYLCFEKDGDTKAVMEWFSDKLKKHNLKTSLCIYNQGVETEVCHYANLFDSI